MDLQHVFRENLKHVSRVPGDDTTGGLGQLFSIFDFTYADITLVKGVQEFLP